MVISTFTPEQIVDEFQKDFFNIVNYVEHQKQRLRRLALKARQFPVSIHGWHVTPMNNKWLYILIAPTKKDWDQTSIVSFNMTYRDRQGKTWVVSNIFDSDVPEFVFYTPHLFARYHSRMNLDVLGDDLIYRYFKYNHTASYSYKRIKVGENQYRQDVTATTQEGVTFGVETPVGVLFKTFISYDMAKGEQIEDFTKSEQARKELEERYEEDTYEEYLFYKARSRKK